MTVWQGILLGIIQGLTEFLPVSSSGHLVLFKKLFGLEEGGVTFEVVVHVATLLSLAVIMRKDIMEMIKKPLGKLTLLVAAGTIPTLLIAAAFQGFIKNAFESGASLGFEFILTGLVLLYAENVRKRNKNIDSMTYLDAGIVGAAQGVAALPAISRSGLTIAGALFRGLNREFALRFSFLLSIPAILAAAAKDVYDTVGAGGFGGNTEYLPIIAGMIAAAVSGYLAVRFMLKVFSKASFRIFSYYVFALGALVILDQLFFGKFFERILMPI